MLAVYHVSAGTVPIRLALAPFHVPSEDARQHVFLELPLEWERHLKHKD